MRSITNTVRSILSQDEVAREAARRGILNASAYAREIKNSVEQHTMKDVEDTSVTVAINRISDNNTWEPIKPHLQFDKISVETGVVDVTFERTQSFRKQLNAILPNLRQQFSQDLFVETTGNHQVTMIMSNKMWSHFQTLISVKPLGLYQNQVAISIAFDEKYLAIPNFIYGVLGVFAIENINVIEIFSTMTEIVVVVDNQALDIALSRLQKYMR